MFTCSLTTDRSGVAVKHNRQGIENGVISIRREKLAKGQ